MLVLHIVLHSFYQDIIKWEKFVSRNSVLTYIQLYLVEKLSKWQATELQ